jgi:hypothetical protein
MFDGELVPGPIKIPADRHQFPGECLKITKKRDTRA